MIIRRSIRQSRRMPGGVVVVTPKTIFGSSLQLWLRADMGVLNGSDLPASNGEAVKTWQDQSGNANHFTQGTAGLRPPYISSSSNCNSKSSIGPYTGASQFLASVNTGVNAPWTVFIVQYTPDPGGNVFSFAEAARADFYTSPGLQHWMPSAAANDFSAARQNLMMLIGVQDQASGTDKFYLNSNSVTASGATGATQPTALSASRQIGAFSGGNNFGGEIAEIGVISGVITAAQVISLNAYSTKRYGVP